MYKISCFKPIADTNSKILILGSMPGKQSLKLQQYYAHPRNLFWHIMHELLGIDYSLPFSEKINLLLSLKIAVWDVLQSCIRESSLDSDIQNNSIIANDFASFFLEHKNITHVFFNGSKAEEYYKKHVLSKLQHLNINYKKLPSTSPANASIKYKDKIEAWKSILDVISYK